MEKLLTIIVPAYNAQKYLAVNIPSFLTTPLRDFLEIIIIDDGSTDQTKEIAETFVLKYPNIVHIFSKENGGHGSAINIGVRIAQGKYIKVIDADDWIEEKNLTIFLRNLKTAKADVILTNYRTVHMQTKKITSYFTKHCLMNKEISIERFLECGKRAWVCCTFHGICYRRTFYLQVNHKLMEGVFYEDQEYAVIPFIYAKSILPLDLFLYEYMVGNIEQSVSDTNMIKHIDDLKKVFWRIYKIYEKNYGTIPQTVLCYCEYKLSRILFTYYTAMLLRNPDRQQGKKLAAYMKNKLQNKGGRFAHKCFWQYIAIYIFGYFHFSSQILDDLKSTQLYRQIKKLI